jgi:hypothetical protein
MATALVCFAQQVAPDPQAAVAMQARPAESAGAAQREMINLHAFARLYGYLRFFHPSDEAAAIDWDRFAIHGVAHVRDAGSDEDLRVRLDELVRPIAPGILIHAAGEPAPASRHVPADTAGLRTVAWQHLGVLLDPSRPNTYWSIRTNRTADMAARRHGEPQPDH